MKRLIKFKSPLLIGGSLNDTTVPVEMSFTLAALNPRAKLYISQNGSHHESEWFFPSVKAFLESVRIQKVGLIIKSKFQNAFQFIGIYNFI